ncbi:MAG: PAS domain S-box protein, partial [Piscinibacter sp.]
MSSSPERQRFASRRLSRAVPWAGALLALAVLAAVAWLGWTEHEEKMETQRARNELLARVLEEQSTRTVETTAIAMASLAELLSTQTLAQIDEVTPLLNQAMVGLPFLRSMAVVDAQGRVLTSTVPRDVGISIEPQWLGNWPAIDRDRLGTFIAGRTLSDMARRDAAVPATVGFVPLMRGMQLRGGDPALLVALVNPDAFANQLELTVADRLGGAMLTGFDGTLLAATASVPLAPGTALAGHPVFRDYLPAREHATYLGTGVRSDDQLVAFRVSRSRPLVVLVEHPHAAVDVAWWQGFRPFAAIGLVVLLAVAAMTLLAWRSLRARETARAQLDLAQAEVARRERELSVTIRSVQDLIFRTDERGAISFVNERWQAIGGDTARDAIGRQLHELVLPEQRAAVRSLFSPDIRIAVRHAQATVMGAGAERTRHFDVAVVPLVHGERIVGFAGSAADVTDRVVAQQKL